MRSLMLVFCVTPCLLRPAGAVDFSHDVLPVLKEHCAKCHTNGKYKGSLSMDTRAALLDSENVVPGKGAESEMILRVLSKDPDEMMPPKGDRLSAKEVEVLRAWIDVEGAGQAATGSGAAT